MKMTIKEIKQLVKEEVHAALAEADTSIITQADVAIAAYLKILKVMPSLAQVEPKIEVEKSGSFYSIVLKDRVRGQRMELARTPTKEIAQRILPDIQDKINKINAKISSEYKKKK
jgi:predicted GTPase